MSREKLLKQPDNSEVATEPTSENIRLHIDLRLSLDEVTDASAEALRSKPPSIPTRKELSQLACRIYDARRTRDRMLSRQLFGEPAWDMLLALYCLPARGELLGITALTLAADIPQTTGHRWQAVLTDEELIERGPPGTDARRQNVRLTAKGRTLLEAYLARLYYCDTPVPPYPEAAGG